MNARAVAAAAQFVHDLRGLGHELPEILTELEREFGGEFLQRATPYDDVNIIHVGDGDRETIIVTVKPDA